MRKTVLLLAIFFAAIIFSPGCSKSEGGLKSGTWRATLQTQSKAEIPFNFILSDSSGQHLIHIINADERLRVEDITVKDDSIFIKLPLFDSEIRAQIRKNTLVGRWIKHLPEKTTTMPFRAEAATEWRFFNASGKPGTRVSGRWSVIFYDETQKDTTLAIGEFRQQQRKVTGSFLTSTGDYRFLEGILSGNKLYLSTFDGSHAYLLTGTLNKDNTISDGLFYAGYSTIRNWTARKDANAMLPDAYALTSLKSGEDRLNFQFPDLQGNQVSLSDKKFTGKVVIVQFLGSWCPNCMDETAYLSSFYNQYRGKGVEVIGLAYERTNDIEKSKKSVEQLQKRFSVAYPLLITGYTNKEVLKSMPSLNDFKAFPTTALIDKKGKVRKIHTGFSGPGTGEHYEQFKQEFEQQVKNLLAEN
ncbi:redoxin family protein [Pedobacter sp. SYSU D00535]|uniref:redoxin family protein n=1 Tax=Pedobacter sp. SYSU D00535 TaxID=2810308 RepID=UPI001A973377|nr:redoxin family protein [Pedobacter sp. SYSU D00535]